MSFSWKIADKLRARADRRELETRHQVVFYIVDGRDHPTLPVALRAAQKVGARTITQQVCTAPGYRPKGADPAKSYVSRASRETSRTEIPL